MVQRHSILQASIQQVHQRKFMNGSHSVKRRRPVIGRKGCFMRKAMLLSVFLLAFVPLERPFGAEVTLSHRAAAALTLQREGTYDLADQLVRCQPQQKVGVWVESRSITIANAVIENCELGIVIFASRPATGVDSTKEATVHVTGAKVEGTIVGIFVSGNGGTVSHNIVTGARYGIVVTGNDYTLIGNQSNDNSADGFLVTGDRNLLEGNE